MSESQPSTYTVLFTPDAESDVRSLDGSIKKQLQKVLEKKLAIDPEGYGTPLHAPLDGYWKQEFASHRVIYRIYQDRRTIVVCAVGARRGKHATDIYKQLEAMAKTGKLAERIAAVLRPLLPTKKPEGPR